MLRQKGYGVWEIVLRKKINVLVNTALLVTSFTGCSSTRKILHSIDDKLRMTSWLWQHWKPFGSNMSWASRLLSWSESALITIGIDAIGSMFNGKQCVLGLPFEVLGKRQERAQVHVSDALPTSKQTLPSVILENTRLSSQTNSWVLTMKLLKTNHVGADFNENKTTYMYEPCF